jgi:hypothetical protein
MKRLVVLCGIVAAIGCGGSISGGGHGGNGGAAPDPCPAGSERCACYGNSTCNGTLQCFSNVCVSLTGSGGSSAGVGGSVTGGRGGTAGSAGTGGATGVAGTTGAAGAAGTVDGGSARTMGVVGCYLATQVMEGYQSVGGMRMWPPVQYGGQSVPFWTPASGFGWSIFDRAVQSYGTPTDVWIMLCVVGVQCGSGSPGGGCTATTAEVRQIVENARAHAPGANIHITGEPLYEAGWTCQLAGPGGPELTDRLAQEAANDASLNVTYAGTFLLGSTEVSSDSCHANNAGRTALGNQAVAKWGL